MGRVGSTRTGTDRTGESLTPGGPIKLPETRLKLRQDTVFIAAPGSWVVDNKPI